MISLCYLQCRTLTTTSVAYGKRNFRKFLTYGKRGSKAFKEYLKKTDDPDLVQLKERGVRPTGLTEGKKFAFVPEMVPEIIVPDLDGFQLKPYVSYRVPEVVQSEFTPQDLFYAVYSKKIAEDFKSGKLDEDGNSIEPSYEELLSAEEAKIKANSVGADKFSEITWVEK
ncbi:large ribosomal subunit protein mL41 [Macrobrachium rosenbergii]|uniref:large ribosomal subunit protein mL41 n=1 Tax=Macrobrachium rosenbergii TaxID=79674 RepID=UPI0034D516A4